MIQVNKGQQFPVQLTVMRTQDTVTTQFLLAGCLDLCFNAVGKQRQYALDGFTFKDNVLTATVNTAQLDPGVYTLTARGRYMGEWWRAVTVPLFEVVATGGVLPTEPVSAQSTAVFSIHQEMTGALARIDALEQKPDGEKVPTEMKLYFKAWQLYNSLRWKTNADLYTQTIRDIIASGETYYTRNIHSLMFYDGALLWKKLKTAHKVSSDSSQSASSSDISSYKNWLNSIESITFPEEMDSVGGKYLYGNFYCLNVPGEGGTWGEQYHSILYSAATYNLQLLSFGYMQMENWDFSSMYTVAGQGGVDQMFRSLKCIFAPNISDSRITTFLGNYNPGKWQRIGEFYIRTDVDWGL